MSRISIALTLALLTPCLGCAHADCKIALDAVEGALVELDALASQQPESDDPAVLGEQMSSLGQEFKRQGEGLAATEVENEDNKLSVEAISGYMVEQGELMLEAAAATVTLAELMAARDELRSGLQRAGQALERECEKDPHACNIGFAKSMLESADNGASMMMALKMVREKAEEAAAKSEFSEIDEAAAELIEAADKNLEHVSAMLDVESTIDRVAARQEALSSEIEASVAGLRAYCE